MVLAFLRIWLILAAGCLYGEPILKENMRKAHVGDFIVAVQDKVYTLLLIEAKEGPLLTIEEVMAPKQRIPPTLHSWRSWLSDYAPGHTCWVRYRLNVETGRMVDYYSFTKKGWCQLSQADSLLSTLLTLQFTLVPREERKKIGPRPTMAAKDPRAVWHPPMTVDGVVIKGVAFDAFRTHWPRDNSELSGRLVEIYIPKDSPCPSYFPYWLEVQGLTGRAKVRVVDSGSNLTSPYPPLTP